MHANGTIPLGFVGGGANSFIGLAHRLASSAGRFQLVGGVFGRDLASSRVFAAEIGVSENRVYAGIEEMIAGELALPEAQRMRLISILTPNGLHYSMAKPLIRAGFNLLCEKPLTTSVEQAVELEQLAEEYSVVVGVAHTYTGYPMVRQMREMIAAGAVGRIQRIDGQYYQGWINASIHDANLRSTIWRLDPQISGESCCIGDIGVHAFNLIEYVTGEEISSVLADTSTLYDDNPLDVDGTVLLRTRQGARGVIRASQIATGEENNVALSVYGDKGGLKWSHEEPNQLLYMPHEQPRQQYRPGNAYNHPLAEASNKLAPGHPEGIFDALGNLYAGLSQQITEGTSAPGAFPGLRDGVRGMRFIHAVLGSSLRGQVWVTI